MPIGPGRTASFEILVTVPYTRCRPAVFAFQRHHSCSGVKVSWQLRRNNPDVGLGRDHVDAAGERLHESWPRPAEKGTLGTAPGTGEQFRELQGRLRGFRPNLTWCLGMALLLGGYVVYGYALSARAAPISLLQPLSASGLLVVALLAVTYLHERFDALEWVGVALLLGGVILLGFSAENRPHWNVGVNDPRLMFS